MNIARDHRLRPLTNAAQQGKVSLGLLAAAVAVLLLLAAGCWVYFHFVVNLRLPQERSLTIQGKPLQVRLESCNDTVVKYTLLSDGTTRYAAIAQLSDDDQAFFQQLPKTLILDYPLDFFLDRGDGQPVPARIEGHSEDWVKYTLLADHSTHYVPLTSLTASDQVVVQQLRTYIECEFPLSLVMTNAQGAEMPAMIVGRTPDLVKFRTDAGMDLYYPINDLSALDQKLMQLFTPNAVFGTHSECLLEDKDGHQLNVRLEGRSANIVEYTLLSDGLVYYLPIEDLSSTSQQLVRMLLARKNFIFPLDYNLTGTDGKPMRVRLDGRTDNIVKYTLLADGREYYFPIDSFAPADQKFLQLMPADLKIEFPLSYILVVQSGESLDARILGRNVDSVNFQLADGKTYVYPLAKLSPASQEFLQLLPANMADKTMQAVAPPRSSFSATIPSPAAKSDALRGSRSELLNLVHNTERMQTEIDNMHVIAPSRANPDQADPREEELSQIEDNNSQIEDLCKEIDSILPKVSSVRGPSMVQSLWSSVMQVVQRDDQTRLQISSAGAAERQGLQTELRESQKSLISFLEQINAQSGQYSP